MNIFKMKIPLHLLMSDSSNINNTKIFLKTMNITAEQKQSNLSLYPTVATYWMYLAITPSGKLILFNLKQGSNWMQPHLC